MVEPRRCADGGVAAARRRCPVRRRVLARRAVCGAGRSARPRRRGSRWGRSSGDGNGLERGLALGFVAGLEPEHPGPVHAVAGGYLSRSLLLDEQGSENQTRLRHRRASPASPLSPVTQETCRRCLETSVADVLDQHTAGGAMLDQGKHSHVNKQAPGVEGFVE
jgi:hypothetical protein